MRLQLQANYDTNNQAKKIKQKQNSCNLESPLNLLFLIMKKK